MVHYVLDTGFFILSRDYYPDVFPTFWGNMNEACQQGIISSVDEVKKELEQYGGEQKHLTDWIKSHSNIFTKPDNQEQGNIKTIFKNKDSQRLMSEQKMLEGGPFADPFVIAKAVVLSATVVTKELPAKRDKNGKIQDVPKIPDICAHFEIKCITPKGFMQQRQWRF